MQAAELRELSDSELVEKYDQFKSELFDLRFALVTGQLDNPVQRERAAAAAQAQAQGQEVSR